MIRLMTALVATVALSASAAEMTGFEVAKKASENTLGFGGQAVDAMMELYEPGGRKSVSYIVSQLWLEAPDGRSKSLVRFVAPADTKGTGLLTHEEKSGDESRWLYLPESRQVKQLAGSKKSASFKGTELAYEDMAFDVLNKYDYELKGEAVVDGRPCYQVRSTPRYQDSGYKYVDICFDKERFVALSGDYYDRAGQLLKKQKITDYKKIGGKWRSHVVEMHNVQTGRKTIVRFKNYKIGVKLPDTMFTVSHLQKT